MFKKLLIASALVLSAVAVTAAETDKPEAKKPAAKKTPDIIQISINLSGDNDATFEVVEKSKNVRPNAKAVPFRIKKPGRSLGFRIPAAAKGKTVATLKLKVKGKGTYNFSGVGLSGAKKGQNVWFFCSSFEIGDKTYIPQGKTKKFPFAAWRALTGAKGIAIDGEEELEVKMTFEKVPAELAAKYEEGAKKRAAAAKAKKN